MIKLKDIIKMIAEEKESGFKPLSDLEHAIEQNKKGSDYYDKTKLKNIFNQLSPEDQKEARKKYSKLIKEEEGTGYEKVANMKYKEGPGASPDEIKKIIDFYKGKEFAWKYGAKDDFEGLAQGRMADIKADTYPKWKKQDFQTVINALDKIFK